MSTQIKDRGRSLPLADVMPLGEEESSSTIMRLSCLSVT